MTTTLVQQHSRQSLGKFVNPSPTKYESTENMDKVVQSVTNATKRLSQISTNTNSSAKKRKTQNRIGPWKLGRTLGRGSTGRVRLAKNVNSGKLAAVKIVPKSNFKKLENPKYKRNSVDSSGSVKDRLPYGIEREIIIMKLISHPNIMGLYDVWENKNDLYLILEYIEGGELFDYLIKKGKLQEFEAISYFKQIINGIHYLHQFNICHRDLKPENLLLDFNKNIKIADFGMAALEVREKLLETSCGSPHYASPEIVAGKNYHGAPSDIWSCGIILFALLTGHLPFDDENIRKLLLKVQNGKFLMPNNLSSESKDLISKMLKVNPSERITIDAILQHPLLTKYPEPSVRKDKVTEYSDLNIRPIDSINNIDKEILKNLSVLFHNRDEQTIISKLLSPEDCSEKTFYYLLVKYRNEHLTASNNTINNYEDDPDLTGSESKQTITRSTSIVKTTTTDPLTGEKHTTIRKIPNSTSNFSNRSRSPKKKPEVFGNINTAPTFKASTSFNKKKTLMNNNVISRNNSSKSLRKRPPQQQPPKLSRKISGMPDLNDLRLEKTQLNSLYKQQKLNGSFGNKSLFNFESVCQEIFGNAEQHEGDRKIEPKENLRKDKQMDGRTGKLSNIEKCERELAAKVHEKNDARALKLQHQQKEEDAKLQHKKQLESKKRDQSKLLQEKQRQALEKLGSQIQDNNDNNRRGIAHRTQQRHVTEPAPTSSLDPKLGGGAKSLLRAKSLASPSSYVSLRQNTHTSDNTSKVLQTLGIEVAPLKTSTKFNSNLKTSSSKNLSDYLDNETLYSRSDKSIEHQKENISMNKFNEKEKVNQSIAKPNYSRTSTSKLQPLAISRTTTLNSIGYRSLLDGIDENKVQKDLPKRPNGEKDYDTTLSTIETRKNGLIPNPRFSRFSFNGLLNSRFDNPDVTIQNNLVSSGTVVRKSVNQKEPISSRIIEEDPQTSHLKLETGSLKKSSTNLLGLGIVQNHQGKTSRKVSQNSEYCDSNFISVNLSDTADDSQDNTTLEENAISLSHANSVLKDDHANTTVSNTTISKQQEVLNTNVDQRNKRKSSYLGNLEGSKETLVENDKEDKSFQDSIKSMYKDYAKLYNDKKPKSETNTQELGETDDNIPSEKQTRERQSILRDDRINSIDSDNDLSFAADGSSNIDILDSSSIADTNMIENRSEIQLNDNKYSPTITDNQKDFGDEYEDEIDDQFSQHGDQQEYNHEYDHENNHEYNQEDGQEQHEHDHNQQNDQQLQDSDRLQTGTDLRKSTASTQIFSTMNLPKIRDKNSVVEENKEIKHSEVKSEESNQRHNSIFNKLKPKREAPKPPGFKWDDEKSQGHNRFSRISVSSKFDKQQKLNDNYNDSSKSNWFMKFINSLTANSKTPKGEKRKSLIRKFNSDKLDDNETKNFCVLDSTLQSSELTRVIKDTLELKKIEGSVSKVDIDEDFGMISGVIPARYSGGRRLRFKIEIINLKNSSSLHLSKLKGTDKGFKNLTNTVKFIVSKEEQNINRMSSVEA